MTRVYLFCSVVGLGGAAASLLIILFILPVVSFNMKLKRQLRELTEYEFAPVTYNPANYHY